MGELKEGRDRMTEKDVEWLEKGITCHQKLKILDVLHGLLEHNQQTVLAYLSLCYQRSSTGVTPETRETTE